MLAYFVLTPQFRDQLRHDLGLHDLQLAAIEQIAVKESEQIRTLDRESRAIIANDALTLEQRRAEIERIEYNDRLLAVVADGQDALVAALGSTQERALVAWIERQWAVEQQEHGVSNVSVASRTYRVFPTRYAGETSPEVSLPDKCLKFANRGWASTSCPASVYKRAEVFGAAWV